MLASLGTYLSHNKIRDTFPFSKEISLLFNRDLNMEKEMKHKGKLRSYESLQFNNNYMKAHFQLCKWPNLLRRHSDQPGMYIAKRKFEKS